jgi:hypothetical protein
MRLTLTFVQLLIFCVVPAWAEQISPYTMLFDPLKNNVRLENQKIDYDLTKETVLRMGPYLLDQSSVGMQITRETGEFYEVQFGFAVERSIGPIYVVSFKWPEDFVPEGVIELIDDKAQSLWRHLVTPSEMKNWRDLLEEQDNQSLIDQHRADLEKQITEKKSKETKAKQELAHPEHISKIHQHTNFGLAHHEFYEIPILAMAEPFRFCVSLDKNNGRLAVCSHRYQFVREAGHYRLVNASKDTAVKAFINDKLVTNKGTAIFLQNDIPIKFSAVLKDGTYFEFVSHPKEIHVVDIASDPEKNAVNVIGYGDAPMGQVNESVYADTVHFGFLNFMPTIGDLRKFWQASLPADVPYLYLKGEGGAPFRQSFVFDALPPEKARATLAATTTKATYNSHIWVSGKVDPSVKLSAKDTSVEQNGGDFRWLFPAPTPGTYNTGVLDVDDGKNVWHSHFDIYRGYSTELSARLSGVLTSGLELVALGEVAGQFWFEDIFGWENYTLSRQRWGVSAKYFQAFTGLSSTSSDPTAANLRRLEAGNVDLKYRLSPGVWGRDPSIGLIASFEQITYGFVAQAAGIPQVTYRVPVYGGGVFWARSMPKLIDDFLNLAPFMRYPKWVDLEFIYYPYAAQAGQTSNLIFNMNFHGKVQWTKNFFGEGGFGVKNFSFSDTNQPFGQATGLSPELYILYGTVGLGFAF